ncbi:MAG TPA: substrate-binding domain-containing protein, partial [Paracoccaceae bacterium]|nr:substrate-binding domain-containing protein [Paracoccaceae bacterium]
MATLKDIANALKLSPATVSRALNGFPEVNAKTRALVEETARKMNYQPNQLAKKLVSGRSGMIGLVLKPFDATTGDSSFFQIMSGLSRHLADRGMDLVFHASSDEDTVAPYRRLVAKNILDGFILNAPEENDPRIAFLKEHSIPFVVHGRAGEADYAFFDIDNQKVTYDSVNLLTNLGHTKIALLNGQAQYAFAVERRAGFERAMKEHGFPVPGFAVQNGPLTSNFGYTAALSLLSGRREPRPTAIICASTVIADGVYRAAKDLNLSIPQDLSVIAHDDAVPEMRAVNFEPALTVTRSPLRDACAPLARSICNLLDGATLADVQNVVPS